jgi:hypothetical protein
MAVDRGTGHVIYLDIDPDDLVLRISQKDSSLNYYEARVDLGISAFVGQYN